MLGTVARRRKGKCVKKNVAFCLQLSGEPKYAFKLKKSLLSPRGAILGYVHTSRVKYALHLPTPRLQ